MSPLRDTVCFIHSHQFDVPRPLRVHTTQPLLEAEATQDDTRTAAAANSLAQIVMAKYSDGRLNSAQLCWNSRSDSVAAESAALMADITTCQMIRQQIDTSGVGCTSLGSCC